MIRAIFSIVLSAVLATPVWAQKTAPAVLVERGACPFECCQYGKWRTANSVKAFLYPKDTRSSQTIPSDETVVALTGYVRTVGQPFLVTRSHSPYRPGDKLMVYTYHGEGSFTVWRNGKKYSEDLGFSPYGGTGGETCSDTNYCWGSLTAPLESVWWAKIRMKSGKILWVKGDAGFEGQDACG